MKIVAFGKRLNLFYLGMIWWLFIITWRLHDESDGFNWVDFGGIGVGVARGL
jgi:hypothetical protein